MCLDFDRILQRPTDSEEADMEDARMRKMDESRSKKTRQLRLDYY